MFFLHHPAGQTSNPPPICCLAHQVVSPCYKYCTENTCENLFDPPKICNITCDYNVCVCDEGYYRNECNECVTAEECRHQCKFSKPLVCPAANEEVNSCFDPTKAKVCENVKRSKPRDIFLKSDRSQPELCALSVCDCVDGYLRNRCGQCVKAADCQKKCCVSRNESCSQPNEIRVKKSRRHRRRRSSKSCKWDHSPFSYARKACKNACTCKEGYIRNECDACVPPFQRDFQQTCLCTNPCAYITIEGIEWVCASRCNQRECRTYHELQNKTCPNECVYVCNCSVNKNLWYNGTHCVPAEQCPPYNETIDYSNISLTHLAKLTANYLSDYQAGIVKN